MLHQVASRSGDLLVRVHHAQWYVPRNRGELPWLTDDLKLVRKQIWNFKDGKAAPWAQGELTALLQMVGWDQGDRILVPIPASTMQRTSARGLANLVEVICSRCGGLVNGTGLIHRFEGVEAKHLSESRGRGLRGLYFDAASIAGSQIVLLDDVVTKGHTILDLARVLKDLGASSVEAVTLARTVPSGGVIENGLLVRQTDSMSVVPAAEVVAERARASCPVPEFKDDDEFLTLKEEKGIRALKNEPCDFEGDHPQHGSFRYAGGMRSGRPHGVGMALFSKGAKYLGHWVDGNMSGLGKMNVSSWGKYRGNWLNGTMHGAMVGHDAAAKFSGVYAHGEPCTGVRESISSGNIYEGEFKHGKPHGKGVFRFPSGSEYTGRFVNGKRHGKGRFHKSGFGVYEGVWCHGSLEGHARIDRKKNGDVYEGEVSKNLPHGSGKVTYANGDRFEGGHRKGKRHGKGKLITKLGEVWTGEWKGKDKFSGEVRLKNGAKFKGTFAKDSWDGPVTVRYRNGDRYEGPVKNWKRNGKGKLKFKKGGTFEGQFRNDVYSGKGVRVLACKDRISGSWKKGVSHGPVKIEYADGAVWEGVYKAGIPNGPARYMSKCGRFHFAVDYNDGRASKATAVQSPFLENGKPQVIQLIPDKSTRLWTRSYLTLEAAGVNMRRLKGPEG